MKMSNRYLVESILFAIYLVTKDAVALPTFGSLMYGQRMMNLAHLYPFVGAGPALGGDGVNALLNYDIATLAPGTSIFFGQPLLPPFDSLNPFISSVAQAQAANVALMRMTQQVGGIMGTIFPMPVL